jgi:tRNA1(Val) A37 N6-methylase TrmN6
MGFVQQSPWKGPQDFDLVVMNPPFHGTHFMDHVRKAFDHLKPGGRLRAVLPASAEVNESAKHQAFRAWALKHKDTWRMWTELPPESFASSGTNVQTVILELKKK